jgi:CRISPR-associated protein Cpf1
MKTIFENFTHQYSVSKTLRFELIPQAKQEILLNRKSAATGRRSCGKNISKVKKTIDEYHKNFIEKSLNGLKLEGLEHIKLYI